MVDMWEDQGEEVKERVVVVKGMVVVQQKKVTVETEQKQWEKLYVCVENCEDGHQFYDQEQEKVENAEYVYYEEAKQKECV